MKTTLFDRPWLLTPEFHATIAARAQEFLAADRKFSPWQKPAPSQARRDDIAVITVSGVLMKRPDDFEVFFGAVDLDALAVELAAAEHDPTVSAVLLHIDSPGGAVGGIPELAAKIRACAKPVVSYSDTTAASAAYWLASQASAVLAAPSALVGSVGVFIPVNDVSAAYHAMGVKVDVIKSGKYKGAGVPGTALTDEQRQRLQDEVAAVHAEFKAAVKARRPLVADSDMEGQVFRGADAAARGLVTGLAADLDAALSKTRELFVG